MVAMTEDFRARWEAERERREIAELEELARLLATQRSLRASDSVRRESVALLGNAPVQRRPAPPSAVTSY